MNSDKLFQQIQKKQSFLCVGLDTDRDKIPAYIKENTNSQFLFNKAIIDSTHDLSVAYKLNLAFYEAQGSDGWTNLEKTVKYIRYVNPEIFLIADAKRGDIGNTTEMYARAFFDRIGFDAITAAPYMGFDSIQAFLERRDHWTILLGCTSNKSAEDFQFLEVSNEGELLFERVIRTASRWGNKNNLMFVIGATRPDTFKRIRSIIPDHFILVPGIGAQGGSLEEVCQYGLNDRCGLLVNSSRSIIFADSSDTFAETARTKALELQSQMVTILAQSHLL